MISEQYMLGTRNGVQDQSYVYERNKITYTLEILKIPSRKHTFTTWIYLEIRTKNWIVSVS